VAEATPAPEQIHSGYFFFPFLAGFLALVAIVDLTPFGRQVRRAMLDVSHAASQARL
jgi:hypothetical protein